MTTTLQTEDRMTAVADPETETEQPAERLDPALPVSNIQESPLNPRRHFDAASIAELADSIAADGLLNPILVRPKGPGRFEIAAGHRRFRAVKKAKQTTVKALIRPMSDEVFLKILTIENLHREDLHPLDEAQGYHTWMAQSGHGLKDLAKEASVSPAHIAKRISLLKLIPEVQKVFLAKGLLVGHAEHLAQLQPADQERALQYFKERSSSEDRLSVAELGRWISSEILCDLDRAPFARTDETLVPAAGACTTCEKHTGHQREFFPEIPTERHGSRKKGDRCLDPECFGQKVKVALGRRLEELKAKHGTVVRISDEWYGGKAPAGVLERHAYFDAKREDPGAMIALVVHGDSIGSTKWISTTKPRQSNDSGYRNPYAAEQKKRKRTIERQRRIVAAILEAAPATMVSDVDELRAIVRGYIEEMQHESIEVYAKLLGLEPIERTSFGRTVKDSEEALRRHVATAEPGALSRILRTLPVASFAATDWQGEGRKPELAAAAKRYRVDVAAIDRELAAKDKPKGKAAKKAPAKKPAKRPAKKKLAGDVRRAAKRKKAKAAK